MKKLILFLISILMIFGLCACSANNSSTETKDLTNKNGEYEGVGQGHAGDIKVKITLENDKIIAAEVIEESESTDGGGIYGDFVVDVIFNQIIAKNSTSNVDTIVGATESCNGLIEAVEDALEAAK